MSTGEDAMTDALRTVLGCAAVVALIAVGLIAWWLS